MAPGGRPKPSQEEKDALLDAVRELRKELVVSKEQMQALAAAMQQDFEKGLTDSPGTIPTHPTWSFGIPSGNEKGQYIAIDLGRTIKGTNLRVCEVEFEQGKAKFDIQQSSYRVPDSIREGSSEELWEFIATCLKMFLEGSETTSASHAGFTFSFPVKQEAIDEAVLLNWLRGFDVKDVIGNDIVPLAAKAFKDKEIPIHIVAVLNDCVGTLVASAYTNPEVQVGTIIGTGSSTAYFQKIGDVPKLAQYKLDPNSTMAMNTQWGEFHGDALPHTKYDKLVDLESNHPGDHTFEKMIAGQWLPEILRVMLLQLHEQGVIFKGVDVSALKVRDALDMPFLRTAEADPFDNHFNTEDAFHSKVKINAQIHELKAIHALTSAISTRAARLIAAGLVAVHGKLRASSSGTASGCTIGVDGSLYVLYPGFRKLLRDSLAYMQDWPNQGSARVGAGTGGLRGGTGRLDAGSRASAVGLSDMGRAHTTAHTAAGSSVAEPDDPIRLSLAEDGNGVGAALVAALTVERVKRGETAGIKHLEYFKNGTKA